MLNIVCHKMRKRACINCVYFVHNSCRTVHKAIACKHLKTRASSLHWAKIPFNYYFQSQLNTCSYIVVFHVKCVHYPRFDFDSFGRDFFQITVCTMHKLSSLPENFISRPTISITQAITQTYNISNDCHKHYCILLWRNVTTFIWRNIQRVANIVLHMQLRKHMHDALRSCHIP